MMLTPQRKLLKRCQASERIIGHLKADHRMDRCHLNGEHGYRLHTVLCAPGYNIRWLLPMIAKKGVPFLRRLYLRLLIRSPFAQLVSNAAQPRRPRIQGAGAPTGRFLKTDISVGRLQRHLKVLHGEPLGCQSVQVPLAFVCVAFTPSGTAEVLITVLNLFQFVPN